MNTIKDNANAIEGSFLYRLHEEEVFDIKLFNDMLKQIIQVSKDAQDKLNADEILEIFQDLFEIYSYIEKSFSSHFNDMDLFSIKNFIEDNLNEWYIDYRQRLRFLLARILDRDYERVINYEDELGYLLETLD